MLIYLKRFGSVTVLNGHIHQTMQKGEGKVTFHTARSTAFPQPEPGKAMRELHKKGVKAFRITSRPGIGASGGEKWLTGSGMTEMWNAAA